MTGARRALPVRIRAAIWLMVRLSWWTQRLRWYVARWAGARGMLIASRAGRVEEIQITEEPVTEEPAATGRTQEASE